MSYLETLSRELSAVGIRGRTHRRILAEIEDHLHCDPEAALGEPGELARSFADELGTARAARAGYAAFAALAVAGTLVVGTALASRPAGLLLRQLHPASVPLASIGLALLAVGAQVAFVAGLLALVRTLRYRRELVVPRAEAVVIGRRALVGLVAGAGCLAGLALVGVELHGTVPTWWTTLAICAAAVGACALAAAIPAVAQAARLQPAQPGPSGDIFADIAPLTPPLLEGRHWALAVIVAGAVGLVVTGAGITQGDPFDGLARGLAETTACLAGFVVLGRYLGLRPGPDASA